MTPISAYPSEPGVPLDLTTVVRLHGGWRHRHGDGEPGQFAIWGEAEFATVPETTDRKGKRVQQHPRQVSLEQLADTLSDMGLPGLTGRGPDLPASKAVLQLPVVGGEPLPAVERPILVDPRRWPRRMTPWLVQVLHVDLPSVVDILGAVPLSIPDGVELGPDLIYWSRACRLVLDLLARQRFAPGVKHTDIGTLARWIPVLDDPRDCKIIKILSEVMPRGCLDFSSDERSGSSAQIIIEEFLQTAMDACLRRWLGGTSMEAPLQDHGPPILQWWEALQREDGTVNISQAQGEQLFHAVEAWMRPLSWTRSATSLRTCLRLEEPVLPEQSEGEGTWLPDPKDRCWNLRYLLQPLDDPSLLVDANEVWGDTGPGLDLLRQRMKRPQEQLLSDLARVSRLFLPVKESLKGRAPVGVDLSTHEAFSFLTDVAPILEECGVGILVPKWWKDPAARLGVRVHVKRKREKKISSGHFGPGGLAIFDWRIAIGDTQLTEEEFSTLSNSKGGLVYIRGMWISVDPARLVATADRWKRRGGEANFLDVLQWSEGLDREGEGLPVVGVDAGASVMDVLRRLTGEESIAPVMAPRGFDGTLRPYQQRGLAWLNFLHTFGLGMCLADDMGLGKTIQLLAFLQRLKEQGVSQGPTLLVCPTSVIGNWEREADRFTPELQVLVHHGPDRSHGKVLREAAKEADLFITNYPLVVRDHEDLVKVGWYGMVMDEAQAVKNPGAKQTQACRKIQASWRVAMTGTPVENRLRDLWSIFSIINPGHLGDLPEFRELFALPIEKENDKAATSMLKGLVQPFLLRRLKTDKTIIQDLPPKIETKDTCTLTKEQASLYQALVDRMLRELEGADEEIVAAQGLGGRVLNQARFKRGGIVLNTLLRLKQVCNHPAQMLGDGSPLHGRSGKLQRLVELLEEIVEAGDKALIFTQFASFARHLQPYLGERLGVDVLLLHGGTSRSARDKLVKRFQDPGTGPVVFLLSIKAGGLGLNLTAANHVVHFDRWWNPAVEDQATDRAYRIGQKMTVHVHKLVTTGTVEDSIDRLLAEKRDLAASIIGTGEDWLAKLSTAQLRELVRLRHTMVEG